MTQRLDAVLRLLRRFGGPEGAETPDAQLLTRFLRRQDEAAFAELVRRHGPMVLSVSRRVLGDDHAAEDAFQVTFLTLACRARSVRRGQALSGWLHRVAYHVALRARAKARRATAVESEVGPLPRPDPATESAWRELAPVLDDELQRLPEQYRGPLVLCGLQGKTHEDAARELGWPVGSLSKRLARGRELLRERLARRGFETPGVALPGILVGDATAGVPEGLFAATVRTAAQTEGLSAAQAALLKEVLSAMFWTRVKRVATALMVVVLVASAIGLGLLAASNAATPRGTNVAPPGPVANDPPRPDPNKPGAPMVALGEKKFRLRAYIFGIAYSPDGKLLAITEANTVRLWDAAIRKEVRSWDVAKDKLIKSLTFSPDSKTLVTAGEEQPLQLWDVATGKQIREFPEAARGLRPSFSADGKRLATIGAHPKSRDDLDGKGRRFPAVRIWDVATGQELKGISDGEVEGSCVAYSPDGQLLAWGALNGSVYVHKVTGEAVFTSTDKENPIFSVYSIAFSPDSKVLAAGVGPLIKLFDARTGKELKTLGEQVRRDIPTISVGLRLHFSPEGETLAALSSSTHITFWDVATGKLNRREIEPTGVSDFTFHPGGKVLATGGGNDFTVRFWDLVNDEGESEPGHPGGVSPVALSPHGTTVVTACYRDGVRFWDRATGKELRMLPKLQVQYLGYGADGLIILGVEDDRLHLYDPTTGKDKGPIGKPHNAKSSVAVSADGKLLAVGNDEVRVYDLASGKEQVKLPGHAKATLALAFGPDGKTLLTAGEEEFDAVRSRLQFSMKVWDLTTGKEVRALPHPPDWGIKAVAFSPDGKLAVTNTHVWDVTTGKVVKELTPGAESPLFSPDGKLLALAYLYGWPKHKGQVELWDTTTWEKVAVLEGHTGMINAVGFSADGKFLVSGSEDTSARVWMIPERKK